ncbi:hypothetical protein YB2330_005664 [Saitoella coloradoensis]
MSKSKANLKGRFETRTTHTTFAANSSHRPPSLRYTCTHCHLSKPTPEFSVTQLQKHERTGQAMHCKSCTPKQVTSLTCVVCGRRMGLDKFAKSQRKNVRGMGCRCLECVAKHHEDPEDLFDYSEDGSASDGEYGVIGDEDEPWMRAARAASPRIALATPAADDSSPKDDASHPHSRTSSSTAAAPADEPPLAEWATVVTRKLKKNDGYIAGVSAKSGSGGKAVDAGWKDPRLKTYDEEKYNVYGEKRRGKKWGAKGF